MIQIAYEFSLADISPEADPLLSWIRVRISLEGELKVEVTPPLPFPDDEEDPEDEAPKPDVDLPPGVDPRDEPEDADEEGGEEKSLSSFMKNSSLPSSEEEKFGPPFSPFHLREGVR